MKTKKAKKTAAELSAIAKKAVATRRKREAIRKATAAKAVATRAARR